MSLIMSDLEKKIRYIQVELSLDQKNRSSKTTGKSLVRNQFSTKKSSSELCIRIIHNTYPYSIINISHTTSKIFAYNEKN